jgi:membrane protease YdiL (CAAX protease family)
LLSLAGNFTNKALLVLMRFFANHPRSVRESTATLLPSESEMVVTHEQHNPNCMFTLTRMLYTVCGASILYRVTWQLLGWYLFSRLQKGPWGLYRVDVWFYGVDFLFLLLMLAVGLSYTPKSELFRWSSTKSIAGAFRSIASGLAGGTVAFVIAIPVFWLGDRELESIRRLIATAMSPIGVLDLIFFVIALAVSGEVIYRGIVFRTLSDYASVPAAVFGSCLLFASVCPVLSFPAAIILGGFRRSCTTLRAT